MEFDLRHQWCLQEARLLAWALSSFVCLTLRWPLSYEPPAPFLLANPAAFLPLALLAERKIALRAVQLYVSLRRAVCVFALSGRWGRHQAVFLKGVSCPRSTGYAGQSDRTVAGALHMGLSARPFVVLAEIAVLLGLIATRSTALLSRAVIVRSGSRR